MTVRDIEARAKRLREYKKKAMAREADPSGLPLCRVMLRDARSIEWAKMVDMFLREHWPEEFD